MTKSRLKYNETAFDWSLCWSNVKGNKAGEFVVKMIRNGSKMISNFTLLFTDLKYTFKRIRFKDT